MTLLSFYRYRRKQSALRWEKTLYKAFIKDYQPAERVTPEAITEERCDPQ